ncbi:hypothetical protein INR49_013259 [Caranx melampygus]|nr:hypothetical protein INR49_013259 [Caranx melampygus]
MRAQSELDVESGCYPSVLRQEGKYSVVHPKQRNEKEAVCQEVSISIRPHDGHQGPDRGHNGRKLVSRLCKFGRGRYSYTTQVSDNMADNRNMAASADTHETSSSCEPTAVVALVLRLAPPRLATNLLSPQVLRDDGAGRMNCFSLEITRQI